MNRLLCGCDLLDPTVVLVLFDRRHPDAGAWCVWCSRSPESFAPFTLEKK
jgi:hypothetical protein